ncbi:MAG: thioredoxin domain-containing protein [Gammaproteobacteria bacterium]|nr:thioredoxin domain-containing protein [Gammaproteobacteria bacterium]
MKLLEETVVIIVNIKPKNRNTHIMKKSKIGTFLVATLSLIFSSFLTTSYAQDATFVEGGHYELLAEVQPVQTGDKIEVVELFWYRCPHCFRLEPYILDWLDNKPENVEFVPIPAVLNEQWAFHGRAFYTFQALGLTELLHTKLFQAIHAERKRINTVDELASWASENGADGEKVRNTFASFAVENKLNFAHVMSRKYGISGVPAIIVDGRYRTSVSLAGSHEKLIEVINFLVEKATKARTS